MANCIIKRDSEGNIVKVLNPNTGLESKVFNTLVRLPHVKDLNQAVEIYNSLLQSNREEGTFTLESEGVIYDTFKEALEKTESNSIDIISNDTIIASIPTSLDERTKEGVVNTLILEEILDESQVVVGGEVFYQVTGKNNQEKSLKEEFLKESLLNVMSKRNFSIKDGLVSIQEEELKPTEEGTNHKNIADTILNFFSGDTKLFRKEKISERNLKLNLLTILSDMGVSLSTLKQYQDKYAKKNQDINPSAEALADIANRVIAYKEGLLTTDNLTEEVMHFIVETLPQEKIDSLKDIILNSEEYRDNFETYNKVYKGDQRLLEKEILGKILKNITLDKVENSENNFIERLFNVIKDFFDNLTLSQNEKGQLKDLNNLVEEYVIQENGPSFNEGSLAKSKEIALMYSLSEELEAGKTSLTKAIGKLTEERQFTMYSRQLDGMDFEQATQLELRTTINGFVEISSKLINSTKSALQEAQHNRTGLSAQNGQMLRDLEVEFSGILGNIQTKLGEVYSSGSNDKVILERKIANNISEISELVATNNTLISTYLVNKLTEDALSQMGEKEADFSRERMRKAIEGEVEDVNQLFSFFGQLHHASNPILNLIGKRIWDAQMVKVQGERQDMGPLLQKLDELGYTNEQLSKLFGEDGGIISKIKQSEVEEEYTTIQMELYNEVKGLETPYTDILEYKRAKYENKLIPLTPEEKGVYEIKLQEKKLGKFETPLNDLYYTELHDKYSKDKLNISGVTISALKDLSASRRSIMESSRRKDGKVILTPRAKRNLNDISKTRKARKNPYSEGSSLKTGLSIVSKKPEKNEQFLELKSGGYLVLDKKNAENDAIIAFDIHKIDDNYINSPNKKENKKTLYSSFLKYIDSLSFEHEVDVLEEMKDLKGLKEGQKIFVKREKTLWEYRSGKFNKKAQGDFINHSTDEIITIIENNINVQLSRTFYDKLGEDGFLSGQELENLNPGKEKEIRLLRELTSKKAQLLSVNRNTTSPVEIDSMSNIDMESIRENTSQINSLKRELKLPELNFNEEAAQSVNEAYRQYLKDKNIEEGSIEELSHLETEAHSNTTDIRRLERVYEASSKGMTLTRSETSLIERFKGDTLFETKLKYARVNLHSYFTRYAPKGYTSIKERVERGDNILLALAELNRDENIDLIVDRSFEDNSEQVKFETFQEISGKKFTDLADFLTKLENNELPTLTEKQNKEYKEKLFSRGYIKNPDYNENYEGGFIQPKKGTKLDPKYNELFAPDTKGVPTKNKDLFEVRRLILETKKKAYEKMDSTNINIHKAVQISKTTTEKMLDIIKGSGSLKGKWQQFQEIIRETLAYRIDDKAYGETGLRDNKVLVKYYTQELEEKSDVSTDHLYALGMLVNKANQYKANKDIVADVEALQGILIKNKRNNRGNNMDKTLKMAESFIDSAIYGKIEQISKEVKIPGMDYSIDLAKVARSFTKYVSLKNLGFNFPIAMTGFTTGLITKKVEEFIGEKINRESSKLASQEYKKLVRDTTTNTVNMKINDTSKLTLLGQAFNQYDMTSKTRNAKYGGLQRAFSQSAMAMHAISDFPITPKIMLTILYDNRMIDGRRYNRLQYFQKKSREGQSDAVAQAEWTKAEENNLYKYMEFSEDGFTWDKKVYDKIGRNIEGKRFTETQYRDLKLKEALEDKIKKSTKKAVLTQEDIDVVTEEVRKGWDNSSELNGTEVFNIDTKKAVEEYLESTKAFLTRAISNEVSNIQGQIPQAMKVTAQRNAIGSMMMLHKGFASISMQRKFKKAHLNLDTGVYEEGTYRTLGRLMNSIVGNPLKTEERKEAFKEFFQPPGENATSEEWLDYELKVRNGRRLLKEIGVVISAAVIFSLIFAATEDDDNEEAYMMGLSNYIMHRTLAESSSNLSFGIVKDFMATVESPLVTYKAAEQASRFWELFDGEIIKRNKYKGLSKRQRYLVQNVVGLKSLYDLHDAETIGEVKDSYKFYNKENVNWATLGFFGLLNNDEKK